MGSVLDLISQALFLDGILAADQVPSPEDANVCFTSLNGIVDTWNTARENLYIVDSVEYQLAASQGGYLVGPALIPSATHFQDARLLVIQTANAVVNGLRMPMDILSSDDWSAIEDQNATSFRPLKLYPQYGNINTALNVWPLPVNIPNLTVPAPALLELYAQSALAQYVTLTDPVALPSGYFEALLYNLAVRIAPMFGAPIDPTIVQMAIARKRDMQRLNENFLRSAKRSETMGGIPTVGIPQPLPPGAQPPQ